MGDGHVGLTHSDGSCDGRVGSVTGGNRSHLECDGCYARYAYKRPAPNGAMLGASPGIPTPNLDIGPEISGRSPTSEPQWSGIQRPAHGRSYVFPLMVGILQRTGENFVTNGETVACQRRTGEHHCGHAPGKPCDCRSRALRAGRSNRLSRRQQFGSSTVHSATRDSRRGRWYPFMPRRSDSTNPAPPEL